MVCMCIDREKKEPGKVKKELSLNFLKVILQFGHHYFKVR